MPAFIETRDLVHIYALGDGRTLTALRGIDLTIERGEFVALVGANGSGKSTLARHFNALLLPTSGSISVNGLATDDPGNLWEIRRLVGMVFQNPENQLVSSTIEEDVAFGPENWGVPRDEMRRRVDQALEVVGLQDQRTRPPHMLSGGQKQLVAIAGALATRPACIVLDEPTSMLDPAGRRRVMETIRKLNDEEHLTIVLISQDMDEAASADRVLAMEDGQVRLDGRPREVFAQWRRLTDMGLGLPSAAQIAHQLERQGVPIDRAPLTVAELARVLREASSGAAFPC